MQLVIAEKPSVAKSIAEVLGAEDRQNGYFEGNGYLVSWCVGHLIELAQPESYGEQWKKWNYESLPVNPVEWKYEIKLDTKEQYDILYDLLHDGRVNEVICATDAGREGELIFRLVYDMADCHKPMKRLWISSMEESAIRDGFANLQPGSDYDNLRSLIPFRTLQTGSGLACWYQRYKAFYGAVWRKGVKGWASADTDACNACGA